MVEDNITPLVKNTEVLLKRWANLWISWMGRVAVITMSVIPRWLFIFSHLLVRIPYKVLKKVQIMMNKFIWGSKKPQFKNECYNIMWMMGGWRHPMW